MQWMIGHIVLLSLGLIMAIDSVFPNHSILVWADLGDGKKFASDVFSRIHGRHSVWALRAHSPLATVLLGLSSFLIDFWVGSVCLILFTIWFILWAYIWIFGGLVCSITWDLMWFGLSLWYLLAERNYAASLMTEETKSKEQEWGFGQILPMILCILPFLAALQEFLSM